MRTFFGKARPAQAQFEALLRGHAGIVFRVANAYSRSSEDRQDLVQEIKVQLWRSFPKYDESRSFSTWMYRIALNVAISYLRRSRWQETIDLQFEDVEDRGASPEAHLESRAVFDAIQNLDPVSRAVLLLYLDDLSHSEIGDVLGITPNNVAVKVSRIKQRLRNELTSKEDSPNGTR
ncbi:MAG: sigma-70 family RNA polymerase sigma factor [Fimbriimonas sp.]|nr:sigma-70 family RNA polymerase sigma factor [Fimbriimonas sp.]